MLSARKCVSEASSVVVVRGFDLTYSSILKVGVHRKVTRCSFQDEKHEMARYFNEVQGWVV